MNEEKKHVYKLYAGVLGSRNETVYGQRFYRVTRGYVLVYTDDALGEPFCEIGEADLYRLTEAEKKWVVDCVTVLLADEIQAKVKAAPDALTEQISALEAALKNEAEMQKGVVADG